METLLAGRRFPRPRSNALSIRFIKTCCNPALSRAGARVLVARIEIRLAFEHSRIASGRRVVSTHTRIWRQENANGIEAMKDMGAPRELTIGSHQNGDDRLLVSVADMGIGFQPENVAQIFSAFFTSKSQGTGVGLPISRSTIESHGGRLWATPNTGPGATFQFVLPIEPSARQTV